MMTRALHFSLGWLCLALAAIGVVLPLMPTTVFVLLAAYFFARGAPQWRARLLAHRRFGPAIAAWERNGAIPRRAKVTAVCAMAASLGASVVLGAAQVIVVMQSGVMLLAATYVLTRPSG